MISRTTLLFLFPIHLILLILALVVKKAPCPSVVEELNTHRIRVNGSSMREYPHFEERNLRKMGLTNVRKILTWPPFLMTFGTEKDSMSGMISGPQFYAPAETQIFYKVLRVRCQREKTWVVDVGANWGFFTLYALKMGCNVIFFEPNPYLQHAIQASIDLNGFSSRVIMVKGVAGEENTKTVFTVLRGKSGFSGMKGEYSTVHARGAIPEDISVDVFRLDSVLKRHNVQSVGLLKVDTEGHELAVFQGLQNFTGRIENIVVEIKFQKERERKIRLLQDRAEYYEIYAYNEDYSDAGSRAMAKLSTESSYANSTRLQSLRKLSRESMKNPPGEDFWLIQV